MPGNVARVAAAVALLAAPAPAHAQTPPAVPLMGAVGYTRQVQFTPHGAVLLHVVTAPRPVGLYALRPLLSNDAVQARERLSAMERRLTSSATIVAVSADHFSARDGIPNGGLIRSGVMDASTDATRATVGVDSSGTLRVDRVLTSATWKGTGQRRPLDVNRPPARETVTLYTRAWGPTTPTEPGAVEAVLSPFPPAAPNVNLQGTVVDVHANGPTPIPPGGGVLVARSSQAGLLSAEAPVGTSVSVRLNLVPAWSDVTDAVGGGPLLVRDGRPVFDAREAFSTAQLVYRQARSAVGQTADGRLVFAVVDGRSGISAGMTNWELALTMVRLGAVTACALDTGPSATLAFDGDVVNRPIAGEQPIADALGVFYSGVYVPPPETVVLSPNGGEGVFTYKVVRPSTVRATLVAPNGGARTIASGTVQPGVQTLKWKPDASGPEGEWTFEVAATDDQGRFSSDARSFDVNGTLAELAVAPTVMPLRSRGGRLEIGFTLSRPAKVRVTIETAAGSVVATVVDRSLAGGRQQVVWDGRASGGRVVASGRYVVRVRADNQVGDVALTAPFRTARR